MKARKPKKQMPVHPHAGISSEFIKEFGIVAHKLLRIMGLESDLYDKLSKKEKMALMNIKYVPIRVVIKKGHAVPKAYQRVMHEKVFKYLKANYMGDPSHDLLLYDLCTYGMTFIVNALNQKVYISPAPDSPMGIIAERAYQYSGNEFLDHSNPLFLMVQMELTFLSKINFRIYGYEFEWRKLDNSPLYAGFFYIYSIEAEKKSFVYRNIERISYRLSMAEMNAEKLVHFSILYNRIYQNSVDDRVLKVYVQNHALYRMKERVDVYCSADLDWLLRYSLNYCEVIQTENKQRLIVFRGGSTPVLGYLPFTIIGDSLYVLSFLPICSQDVPEGNTLCKILNLNKEDTMCLGMDKLSFFLDTDFDALPILKSAIVEAGLLHLVEMKTVLERTRSTTPLLRKYFSQPYHERCLDDVFEEIDCL